MDSRLSDKVFAFTSQNVLLPTPCHVLVGVSGGADSMALLHLLSNWPSDGIRVSAVHINHGLRGEMADRDERFVRDYCQLHGVPLSVLHEDVAMTAREERLSLEEAGRRVRYTRFETVRCAVGADYIVTAHTASDQTETLLMNIVRGCGLEGLTGIPAMRDRIRRPLLCCNREEIERYCIEQGIDFVTDETNGDTQYTRNYIRHRVLPVLRKINPTVDRALLRLQEHSQEDASYLQQLAHTALETARCRDGYLRQAFEQQPSVIRRRMIRTLFQSVSLPVFEEIHIVTAEQAVLRGNVRVSLPNGWIFAVEHDSVLLYSPENLSSPEPQEITDFPAEFIFGAKRLLIERLDAGQIETEKVHNLFLYTGADYDMIKGKLLLRYRLEGDYMHPSGRGIGKSLKKMMNEWHIPTHLREVYPLLCDDEGVFLVPGYACDERTKIADTTKHYLVCKWIEEQG